MKNYHTNEIPHIKSVQLKVTKLDRSLAFYTKVLGLSIIQQNKLEASLGNSKGQVLIDLIELNEASPRPQRFAGLYHVALLVPTRKALAKLVQHFIQNKITETYWDNMTDEEVIADLTEIKGIGVWTAEMILLFCMQRPDVFSYDDLAIQRGLRMVYHHRKIDRKLFEKYRRRFSP